MCDKNFYKNSGAAGKLGILLIFAIAVLVAFSFAAGERGVDRDELSTDALEPVPFKIYAPEPEKEEVQEPEEIIPEDESDPEDVILEEQPEQEVADERKDAGGSDAEKSARPKPKRRSIDPARVEDSVLPTPFRRESLVVEEPESEMDSQQPDLADAEEKDVAADADEEVIAEAERPTLQVEEELKKSIERAANVVATDEADELLYEALYDVQDGYYQRAIPKLEKVIELKPNLGAAWESLGWCYYRTGEPEKTKELWQRFRMVDSSKAMPYNLLGKLAVANDNLDQAVEYYRKSLEIDPDQYNTRYALARTLRWQGSLDVAIEMLRDVRQDDQYRNDVVLELARSLTDNWDYAEALPLWRRLREFAPDNLEYMEGEAICLLHTEQPEDARQLADEILERDPENKSALMIKANLAERGEQPEEAIPYLKEMMANEDDPQKKESIRVRLLRLYVRLNKSDPREYDLAEPIKLTRERIEFDPDSVDARLLLGELLLMARSFKEAEQSFNYVLLRMNPYNLRVRKGLFETKIATRDYKGARDQLVAMAEFDPHNPYLYYYIARLKSARGDYYGAEQALLKLERTGEKGAVPVFLYHGLTPSSYFMDALSVSRFREHIRTLKNAGFRLMPASDIPDFFRNANYYDRGILVDERNANIPPERIVVIDFDDARRDSMEYATEVARQENAVFSMHIPTGYVDQNHPFICTWDQLEKYKQSGFWDYGSHVKEGAILAPINAQGRMGHALPNRIWLEDLDRLETRREYIERLENEFAESKKILQARLGGDVNFVSYPFGDIGQEVGTNVRKPVRAILDAARPHYEVGFIQSPFGFAVNSDDPLLCQRYEMDRWACGQDVIEHIFENHPVYLARRMRAEMAALQGKQYRARDIIEGLRQINYPDKLLEDLKQYVHDKLARKIEAPEEIEEQSGLFYGEAKPYLGAEIESFSDNQDRSSSLYSIFGGFKVNPRLSLEGRSGIGSLDQDVPLEDTPEQKRSIDVDEVNVGGRIGYVLTEGAYMQAEALQRSFSSTSNDWDVLKYALEGQLRPVLACDLIVRYEHDAAPSALSVEEEIDYSTLQGNGVYRLSDYWDLTASLMEFDFSDDNNRVHYSLGSSWLLQERTGLRGGVGYAYASADNDRDAYWTPYELGRFYVEGGYQGQYMRSYYNFRVRVGTGKESVRPEDEEDYRQQEARAARLQFDPGPPPSEDWETVVSVFASGKVPLKENWLLQGQFSYSKLPNYDSMNIEAGIRYNF